MKYKPALWAAPTLGGLDTVDRPRGQAGLPDAMTWAKRAQVGFVNSRFEDQNQQVPASHQWFAG